MLQVGPIQAISPKRLSSVRVNINIATKTLQIVQISRFLIAILKIITVAKCNHPFLYMITMQRKFDLSRLINSCESWLLREQWAVYAEYN